MPQDVQDGDAEGAVAGRTGSFGALRLVLAAAVIVGHAPELLDGDRLREPLTRAFGTLSLAELAVDGFFLLSGFLVTGSWRRSTPGGYLAKRLVRLYPGFLVAFAVSMLVVGPLAGGSLAALGPGGWAMQPANALAMLLPDVPGAFASLPYPSIDGALWTIAIELRCYLLVMLLGRAGMLDRPVSIALLAAGCFALHGLVPPEAFAAAKASAAVRLLVVDPSSFARLAGHFLTGALLLRLWPAGRASAAMVAAAAAGLLLGLSVGPIAEPAAALFGGVLLLAASRAPLGRLARVGERTDLSYGVYLYAWPVTSLLILWRPALAPLPLAALTLAAAAACGFASWHLVEAPALRWRRRGAGPRGSKRGAEIAAA